MTFELCSTKWLGFDESDGSEVSFNIFAEINVINKLGKQPSFVEPVLMFN